MRQQFALTIRIGTAYAGIYAIAFLFQLTAAAMLFRADAVRWLGASRPKN